MYIHQLPNWPDFTWNTELLSMQLAEVRHGQGRLIGRMEALGFKLRQEANLQTLTLDVLTTSEIEGLVLQPEQVRSSLARRLGMDIAGLKPADREVDGIVEMLLDATQNFNKELTEKRLFRWQAALFSSGRSSNSRIIIGTWRDDHAGLMQVISGPIGRERVHFEAPPAESLAEEMRKFLDWFENAKEIDPVLKSGVAHIWFVTIHPFEDGNGRIARAIADMALAQSEQISERFYSMSAQIRKEKNAYYEILEQTQQRSLDITAWMQWYLSCLSRAIEGAQKIQANVLHKSRFWDSISHLQLNDRQNRILDLLLDGFEGKLTSSKWAKMAKCSQDTAHRDILDLVVHNILRKDPAGGRSTSYSLAESEEPKS